ncbi:MAG TPA: ferredoxin reductase family protein [Streptosporangiaceae bacterium]|nr:ferredoxin reductase family protein [Streptosporangiaceae bacterium]
MTSVTGPSPQPRPSGAGALPWSRPGRPGSRVSRGHGGPPPEATHGARQRPPGVRDKKGYVRVGPGAVLAVIAFGAAGVIALWWHSTPDVSGLGGWLTGAGEILGLLAGYGVVVLVALMARLPPLERGIGTDRLVRWHSMGGRYIVSVVVAHGLLILWGYAVEAHTTVVSEAAALLTQYPDVLMATVAGFLLLGVGIVSMRAARRRMRYETWYYLHLYTYLAIALAFSHQFAVGASFISNLAARFWWSAMYLTVAVLVAWYRVVVPLRAFARHDFTVIGVKAEGPGVISVYIGGKHLDELDAEPGQFFRWRFLTRSLWWSSHPYSLSAAPGGDVLRITAKDLGDHSRALNRLRPGTRVIAEGPYGAFTAADSGRGVLLLAGGVGITPLRAMFATLPGPVTLIYRASSEQDIVFRDELDAIAAARGGTVYYLVGTRAEIGGDPLSPRLLHRLVPGLDQQEVYVCGPGGMVSAAVDALRAAGVPRKRIHFESFEF